jgi:hypothetical protein
MIQEQFGLDAVLDFINSRPEEKKVQYYAYLRAMEGGANLAFMEKIGNRFYFIYIRSGEDAGKIVVDNKNELIADLKYVKKIKEEIVDFVRKF